MDRINDVAARRFALALAIQAEIEGMKTFNRERERDGFAFGYNEGDFQGKAEELRILAHAHEDTIS